MLYDSVRKYLSMVKAKKTRRKSASLTNTLNNPICILSMFLGNKCNISIEYIMTCTSSERSVYLETVKPHFWTSSIASLKLFHDVF